MKIAIGRRRVELLAHQGKAAIRRLLKGMGVAELLAFDADFECWAHDSQLPPPGEDWTTWLLMAGRGFGKTRAGSEWVHRLARRAPEVRIALVGATLAEARAVMVEGVSGARSGVARFMVGRRWAGRSQCCRKA